MYKKLFLFAFSLLLLVNCISVNSSALDSILSGDYFYYSEDNPDNGFHVCAEDRSWVINTSYYINSTHVTYSISDDFTQSEKAIINSAEGMWASVMNFENKQDGTGWGQILKISELPPGKMVKATLYHYPGSTTLSNWNIEVPDYVDIDTAMLAHEFGHVIGLLDLPDIEHINNIMYKAANSPTKTPTQQDLWGAKVVLGIHNIHNWVYEYAGTNTYGNLHRAVCSDCGGIKASIDNCSYNSNNICVYCGIPYGYQPYNYDTEEYTE